MNTYNGYLSNYISYKGRLQDIARKLLSLSESDNTHLADVGCVIGHYRQLLGELQTEVFAAHETEVKASTPAKDII